MSETTNVMNLEVVKRLFNMFPYDTQSKDERVKAEHTKAV